MLLTDTNVLQRICLGSAIRHVNMLRARGVKLATTGHNAAELHRNLAKLGLSVEAVAIEADRTLEPFELIMPQEYLHWRNAADARLGEGGKPDWPLLAAALAIDAEIWSEDRDFFGTGVPVWSTPNLRFVQQD